MEKLTKENIYIDIRGKSKEELTDLWEFLDKAGEKQFIETINDFLNNYDGWIAYQFSYNYWQFSSSRALNDKTEVTIEQLKEIIKPMENKEEQLRKEAKERGYTHDNFKCLINRKSRGIEDINKWYYNKLNDTLYTMIEGEGGNVVYREGEWAELYENTLEQQLQKAEAEVKRLKDLINKPKVGDWAMLWEDDEETPVFGLITDVTDFYLTCNGSWEYAKKITNKQLIESLENESRNIKE